MRTVNLSSPSPVWEDIQRKERLARLTRHLYARLLDLGPSGPKIISWDTSLGQIQAKFSSWSGARVAKHLASQGVQVQEDGETVWFYLAWDVPFESLDYVWGCLFPCLEP